MWGRARDLSEILSAQSLHIGLCTRRLLRGIPSFSKSLRLTKQPQVSTLFFVLAAPAYHIALLINTQAGRTGIELYVPSDKTIGHLAIANKELFEERLGLAAEPFDAKKASGVRFYKDSHPIKDNEGAWPGYI